MKIFHTWKDKFLSSGILLIVSHVCFMLLNICVVDGGCYMFLLDSG